MTKPRLRRTTRAGAPPRKKLAIKKSREIDEETLPEYVEQYLSAAELAKVATERASKMKENLRDYLKDEGIEDEKGHMWVDVPGVGALKHERRVSTDLDHEAIDQALRGSEYYPKVFKEVTIIEFDEEAFYAAAFELKWGDEDLAEMKTETVTWAFKVTK